MGVLGAGAVAAGAAVLPPAGGDRPAAEARKVDSRVDQFGDPLPPGALARMGTTRLRHGGQVHAVAFSPDGKTIASTGADGAVRVWAPATGKELVHFVGRVPARSIAFSPDGKLIASTGQALGIVAYPVPVHLWDAATGKELRQLNDVDGSLLVFAPDGQTLAMPPVMTCASSTLPPARNAIASSGTRAKWRS